ncbi:hypothetical protein [Peijinzhouia sedimentorum]
MNTIDSFIQVKQQFINDWAKNPNYVFEESVFSRSESLKRQLIPYINYLPEPYIGCIKNPSAVFLNYNPGPVLEGLQEREIGKFIINYDAVESYVDFARTVPYFEPKGRSFWYPRKRFVARLLGKENDDFHILGLEICPWHSQSFKLTNSELESLKEYVMKEVLPVAEAVAKNAPLSTIFSVGKSYYDLFRLLDFKKVKEFKAGTNIIKWPKNAHGKPVARSFSLWESKSGFQYFNTYAQGGNTMSSQEFNEIIKHLLGI